MSKIGRKPIDTKGLDIKINGQNIVYKGPNFSGEHELPYYLKAELENDTLNISFKDDYSKKLQRENKSHWGLHRALLANKLAGARKDFEKQLRITGLGFKAQLTGSKVQLSLGYTHKIDMELPAGLKLEIDKTGQILNFKSAQKDLLGFFCDKVRALRPTEPYKGTGIRLENEVIFRKAGKAKS